ncbi:hypothetical protein [Nonlabens sp. Asnod3-H03]|uniref:hypothetical protein n=1 Tax=Nonlabens sp. Asnod3-H03 TaxID=3160580 RepID=UPI003862F34A
MSGFKLIGIRANKGCTKKYSKVLRHDVVYHFSQEYQIEPTTDKILEFPEKYIDLYSTDNLKINISAIAGKNGTGKSTVMELFFMIVNNLSRTHDKFQKHLDNIEGLNVTLFFKTDQFYKIEVVDSDVKVFGYNKNLKPRSNSNSKFDFNKFFYTVAINYSQYALNSKEMGYWLNGLFHKNDGYQIPIVINPMRTDGNFNINTENDLVQARLITNLLRRDDGKNIDFRKLTDSLEVSHINLKTHNKNKNTKILYKIEIERKREKNKGKIDLKKNEIIEIKLIDLKVSKTEVFKFLNKYHNFNLLKYFPLPEEKEYDFNNLDPFIKQSLDYLYYKVNNIAITYPEYQQYFNRKAKDFYPKMLSVFIKKLLIEDTSHIVFKIKQTLNFLKYNHIDFSRRIYRVSDLSKRISDVIDNPLNKLKEENRIELLPPPIFKTKIILKPTQATRNKKQDQIDFNTLSSGEKQMINSVSSLLYHLINLDSVFHGYKYKRINVLFDEIELYFHPELQRRYIANVIDSVKALKFNKIKELNFCFVTHSPFILSDIPSENIMFLEHKHDENDKLYSKQVQTLDDTFCSNIHDLLAKSFFMDNGFMGKFSVNKVKEIISELKEIKIARLNTNYSFDRLRIEEIRKTINIIGEPLLRHKLIELFKDSTEDYESNQERIERLELELKEAKKEALNRQ